MDRTTTKRRLPSPTPTKKEHYGFVIYRTAHKEQAQWERFMTYLKHQVRSSLEAKSMPEYYDHLDRKVIVYTPLP